MSKTKEDLKGQPHSSTRQKSQSLTEEEIVDRIKTFGGPLIKSLKGSAQITFIKLLFNLTEKGIKECLEFYGGDLADALKTYDSEACSLFFKKLNNFPKEVSLKFLKDHYGGKVIEALSEKPVAQSDFIEMFIFGTNNDESDTGLGSVGEVTTDSSTG